MRAIVFLILGLGSALALPDSSSQRIIGGSYTTIDQYPQSAVVMRTNDFSFYRHNCGGTILNNVAILSAAHCHYDINPLRYRIRVGSTFAHSGGVVLEVQQIINHPNYNEATIDNDIAVIRLATFISFTNLIQPGAIAGPNYNVPDNQAVWSIGWGITEHYTTSETLKEVQIWSISQEVCRQRWGVWLTDNMICSGVLDVGDRGTCTGDSGGPLLHNNVVVGVCSFGPAGCVDPVRPNVSARVSRYTDWIIANAQ